MKSVKKSEKKNEIIFEKCPFILNCNYLVEKECKNRRLNDGYIEPFDCEDCELNIPDYGVYCDTSKYEKCESYNIISV